MEPSSGGLVESSSGHSIDSLPTDSLDDSSSGDTVGIGF